MNKIKEFFKNRKIENLPNGAHAQWISLNRLMSFYRSIGVVFFFVSLISWILMGFFLLKDPIVVVLSHKNKVWTHGETKIVPIEKDDIIDMVKRFIEDRYQWKKLSLSEMLQNIHPITTSGLFSKIESDLVNFVKKEMKDKSFSQSVSNIEVNVGKNSITAKFDRVLRINDLPLVAPLELSMELVSGSRTRLNPIGIYINGIIEHQRSL